MATLVVVDFKVGLVQTPSACVGAMPLAVSKTAAVAATSSVRRRPAMRAGAVVGCRMLIVSSLLSASSGVLDPRRPRQATVVLVVVFSEGATHTPSATL